MQILTVALWLGGVAGGIALMQWGASQAASLLDAVRGKYGLPATAGGAIMGLATAAPETAVNVSSVAFGWPDLGLGAALGSNVPALPLAFLLSFLATRLRRSSRSKGATTEGDADLPPVVQPQAVRVHVLPYLAIVILLGALTLPPAWQGLQPVDALILVAAWAAFFAHAMLRKPWTDGGERLPAGAVRKALLFGLPAIALGALVSVVAAQKVGSAFGWSDLVVGLFVIGFLCALPEAYSAWRFARDDKPTMAVSATMADGIVSLSIALIPIALVGATVGNVAVYVLNLGFLVFVLTTYAVLNGRRKGQELGLGFVSVFVGAYTAYALAMAYLLI
jgi:cation:H+ antiporter